MSHGASAVFLTFVSLLFLSYVSVISVFSVFRTLSRDFSVVLCHLHFLALFHSLYNALIFHDHCSVYYKMQIIFVHISQI